MDTCPPITSASLEPPAGQVFHAAPCSPLVGPGWELWPGDSLDVIRKMESATFDAVIADPPYMIGATSIGDEKHKSGSYYDLMNAWPFYALWMGEAWRMLKPTGYLVTFMNWRTFPMIFRAIAEAGIPAHSLAPWDKEWIGPATEKQLRPTYELILFSGKPQARIENRSKSDIFRCKWMAAHSGDSGHPAQKPVPLLREIVELVTPSGGKVFDPFSGSSTTGIAALQLGRSFVGVEGNPVWVEDSAKRLREAAEPLADLFHSANASSAGSAESEKPTP